MSLITPKLFLSGCKSVKGSWACSTGTPSIDILLGAGIPIGALLFLEDESGNYSQYFSNRFCADATTSGHKVIVAGSLDCQYFHSHSHLGANDFSQPSETDDDVLNRGSAIAWRYKNMPLVDSSLAKDSTFDKGIKFDDMVNSQHYQAITFDFSNPASKYRQILDVLKTELTKECYDMTSFAETKKSVLRVLIADLGSACFGPFNELVSFVTRLKLLLQNRSAVAIVAGPSCLLKNELVHLRIKHHCDAHFALRSFSHEQELFGAKVSKFYQGFKGLIKVGKLPSMNSLNFPIPDCLDLAFKWKSKNLVIEKIHTPPCLEEDSSTQNRSTSLYNAAGCLSGTVKSKLDF